MAEGEQLGQKEQGKQLEILDLKNHGALYGRFLLASLPGSNIANIIDPDNETVGVKDLTPDIDMALDSLKKINYNPVFENFSLAERKEQWKDFKPSTAHPTAYSQWRTEFTNFMVNIQDPQREKALRAILSNNKEAKAFTVGDADALFNDFCQGKSDITNFLERVMPNLASGEKINPAALQELLPHLQWIASGLFGKNTASQVITRLIELESELFINNRGSELAISTTLKAVLNKERINSPTDDEKRVLGLLRDSLPVPQGIEPPPPAPPKKSDKDEPPPPPHKPVIEEVAIKESMSVRLKVDGKDLGFAFYKAGEGDYILFQRDINEKSPEFLDIPEGIEVSFNLKLDPNSDTKREIIRIIGGKGARLNVKDLYSLGIVDTNSIDIVILSKYPSWKLKSAVAARHEGQAIIYSSSDKYADWSKIEKSKWVSMDELVTFLKTRAEEIKKQETTGEDIISVEGIASADLPETLNKALTRSSGYHETFSFLPDLLKEYMFSLAKGFDIKVKSIKVDEDNRVIISGLRISKLGAKITLDLILSNDEGGIAAKITKFDRNPLAKTTRNSSLKEFEEQFKNINSAIKKRLDEQISEANIGWKTKKVSISEGKVLIEFEKSPNQTLEDLLRGVLGEGS